MTPNVSPNITPNVVIVGLWLAWIISWVVAAAWTGKTEKRLGAKGELSYRLAAIVGVIVLVIGARVAFRHGHGHLGLLRLWSVPRDAAWVCAALVACGFAFCWWARIHLGTLWSASITKKENHRVIETGPYRIVRHPIYTGLLLAAYAAAAANGTVVGIVIAAVLTAGLWAKARLEERWLSRELDAGAYEAYRRRVPMLIPFSPR
jgi:protein-S-isoprenylcysteine O-methyltransferase Ste14